MKIGTLIEAFLDIVRQTDPAQRLAVIPEHASTQIQTARAQNQTQIDNGRPQFLIVTQAFPERNTLHMQVEVRRITADLGRQQGPGRRAMPMRDDVQGSDRQTKDSRRRRRANSARIGLVGNELAHWVSV
ncbi:MAG TPA: hypothetical protein PLS67_11805, partial [Accumulibacter sp.]|nr:hypothetical protein [Accumulibacter sp.]